MQVINLNQKLSLFSDHWSPKIIGRVSGHDIKLAKIAGDFIWHDHAEEDELFFVISGTLYIDFRERATAELNPGDMIIAPAGVEHRPRTKDGMEVQLMLVEPGQIKHTGDVEHELTVRDYERI
ncbi:MAG: cupin domain-containing protein [Bacteroidota bacterium]